MTKEQLDAALSQVTSPAPVILVGSLFPLITFGGYNDPYDGFYRGARVQVHPGLGDNFAIDEAGPERI